MSNANKQIKSTSDLFGLSQYSGVVIILNDKVKVLSPEIIVRRIAQRLREEKSGGLFRFNEIAFVIFISETHSYKGGDTTSLFTIEGPKSVSSSKSITEYLKYIYHSWAVYNGGNLKPQGDLSDREYFDNFQEGPEMFRQTAKRSEARAVQYRKNRYMKNWSDNKILAAAARS